MALKDQGDQVVRQEGHAHNGQLEAKPHMVLKSWLAGDQAVWEDHAYHPYNGKLEAKPHMVLKDRLEGDEAVWEGHASQD